jgi:predicted O-methyltransferase YrrM
MCSTIACDGLDAFLEERGFSACSFEGHCGQVSMQQDDIRHYAGSSNVLKIMEIGFNAGHSADTILSCNPAASLTSFDIGHHDYVLHAKEYIDATYPDRHTLIIGDSTKSIPTFIETDAHETKFDIIFIDGGHDFPIVQADVLNCKMLAHKDTIVILDDTVYTKGWEQSYTIGPTRMWMQQVQIGSISEIEAKDYHVGRGQSVGKFVL